MKSKLSKLRSIPLGNLLSLLGWQAANYVIPLLLLPLFSRKLGVEGMGIYGVGLGVANVGLMITDWGFLYSSQRAMIAYQGDKQARAAVIWETLFAKLALGTIYGLLVALATFTFVSDTSYWNCLTIAAIAGVTNAISMEWLLRADQRFGSFSIASVVGRSIAIPVAIVTVQSSADASWALASTVAGQFSAAFLSMLFSLKGGWGVPTLDPVQIFARIRDSSSLFASAAATNLYTLIIPPLIASMTNLSQAGIYTGADRMKGAARMLLYPITIFTYPKVSQLRVDNDEQLQTILPRLVGIFTVCSFLVCAAFALAAPLIVEIILGKEFAASINVLRLMALSAFLSSVNSMVGTNVLVSHGVDRSLLHSQVAGLIVGGAALIILIPTHGALGAAIAAVFGDLVTFVFLIRAVVRALPWFLGRLRLANRVSERAGH